jgi:nicotinamide-nucleotide amidase
MTSASICTIGDEILIGQVVDTNSSHISRTLNSLGIKVTRMLSIGDDHDTIVNGLEGELQTNDIVIVTGGLGPTKDDITKQALAELSGSRQYRTDERQLEIVHRILSSRGLDILDINIAQASVPDTCEVIPNRLGTAPIMVFRFPVDRFGHKATLYSLPGVPFEALGALEDISEDIRNHYPISDIYHKTVMTFGIAESALSKMLDEWEDALPSDMHLAYLPDALTGVRLRLSIYGGSKEEQEARIEAEMAGLKAILGDAIY